ncbi:MAG: DUF2231 domain-containing protein [Cyanobacteria bacterium REEB65]|nr:DUF2231 domain-containing protein [Cyanobacteria bacterium REEB65]
MVVARHPLHPMLVHLPIGTLVVALVADCIYLVSRVPFWWGMAFWCLVFGVIGMLIAIVPGLWDYVSTGRFVAPRLGLAHMGLNGLALAVYVADIILRVIWRAGGGWMYNLTFALTVAGMALLIVGGWIGGLMVYNYRVAVAETGEAISPRFRVTLAPDEASRQRARGELGPANQP